MQIQAALPSGITERRPAPGVELGAANRLEMRNQHRVQMGDISSGSLSYAEAPIGFCSIDADLRFLEINDWLAAMSDLSPVEHVGRTIAETLPGAAERVEEQLRQVIETGEPILEGLAYAETTAHPGIRRLYEYNCYAHRAADATVLGVRCVVQDVTQHAMVDVAGVIPWEADARTLKFSYVDRRVEEMLGYPMKRWYENGFRSSCIHPDDRKPFIDYCSAASHKGVESEFEYRMIKADGNTAWFRDVISVQSVRSRPIILRGCMFDISDLKQAQEHVGHSERRLRQFLETARDALILVRCDGSIVFANDQVSTVLGYRAEELIGAPFEVLIPHRFRQEYTAHQHSFFAAPTKRTMGSGADLFALRKDGTECPVEIGLSYIESGEDVLVLAVARDLSNRVEGERALRAALAEVERLKQRFQDESVYLRNEIHQSAMDEELVGESPGLRQVKTSISQVAPTESTVLIVGETGTGKELIARAVHAASARANRPLVKVNCATLPPTLIESELFGHEKGAFTGAVSQRIGRFELADGGTIFLDEIGDLPIELQPKLLRVLQEGEFERLGSTETLKADVRVITATNQDLEESVAAGEFRKDLYYRLLVFPIQVPPLRDRRGDIPLLVWYCLGQMRVSIGRSIESVPDDVMQRLKRYPWPGNVRELRNVIERAVILTRGKSLYLEPSLGSGSAGNAERSGFVTNGSTRLDDVECAHIRRVLEECGWRVKGKSNAAERLGLHPSTLLHRLKKLGIKRPTVTHGV